MATTVDERKSVRLSPELDSRLVSFADAIGERTKNKTVERLLNAVGSRKTDAEALRATFENVMKEGAPIVIFGLPNSGKSFTLRAIALESASQGFNVILVDIANEHRDFGSKVNVNIALTRRFRKGIFRVVPEADPRSRQLSISRFFEHMLTLASKGKLHDFAVFIDEGNELVDVKELRDFLIESRKFLKKAVIVSADPEPFEKICKAMKPLKRMQAGSPVDTDSARVSPLDQEKVLYERK